jgi:hypothetical protein
MEVMKLERSSDQKLEKEKIIFEKVLEDKNITIAKLEKEVAYLTTLMSYWKPLD